MSPWLTNGVAFGSRTDTTAPECTVWSGSVCICLTGLVGAWLLGAGAGAGGMALGCICGRAGTVWWSVGTCESMVVWGVASVSVTVLLFRSWVVVFDEDNDWADCCRVVLAMVCNGSWDD